MCGHENINLSSYCDQEKKKNVAAVKARPGRVKKNPQINPFGSKNLRKFF